MANIYVEFIIKRYMLNFGITYATYFLSSQDIEDN